MRTLSVFRAELKESFFMAVGAVVAHKLRSALTLLGVLVGVFSIIVVMTSMRAMQEKIEANLNQLGGQTFFVQTWPAVNFEGSGSYAKILAPQTHRRPAGGGSGSGAPPCALSVGLEDEGVAAGPMSSGYAKGPPTGLVDRRNSRAAFPPRIGYDPGGPRLAGFRRGRPARRLRAGQQPGHGPVSLWLAPGGTGRLNNGVKYTVVGVLEAQGAMEGGHQDNFALIPITTGITRYEDKRWLNLSILVQARGPDQYDDTVDQVRGIMRQLRKVPPGEPDDFEIISNDSIIEQMKSFTSKLRIGIALISSIALIAAGIGIMNIMLVSVTERTREIGIRRAIGAKKRSIMAQFIMEAVVLCELGGAAGVALGVAGGDIIAHFLNLPKVFPLDWILIGLGICSLVGDHFWNLPGLQGGQSGPD